MNIDGVRVLSQEAINEMPPVVPIVCWVLLGIVVITAIWLIITEEIWTGITLAISATLLLLWIIITGVCGVFDKPSDRNIYKCIFEEDIPVQELYDKYEIIDKDGEIWILEDKE